MKNSKFKKMRFIERDFLYNRIKNHSPILSDEQINEILDDIQIPMSDLTFNICITEYGMRTMVFDNNLEQEIEIKDLNYNASLFYQDQVKEYVQNHCFTKILEFLSPKKEKAVMYR